MTVKRWHVISKLVEEKGWKEGCEVGVKEGENLFYIMDNCPDLNMVGIDAWLHQPWQKGVPRGETYEQWNVDGMYDGVRNRAENYNGRCRVIKSLSVDAADEFPDERFDFVFIDAQHTTEGVAADIKAWESKVKKGGWLMGHDIHFETVKEAVKEAYPDYGELPNFVWVHIVE